MSAVARAAGDGAGRAEAAIARVAAAAVVLVVAALSFHFAQRVKDRRENPCRHCVHAAFHDGERLVTEANERLDFATRADAARFEAEYALTPDPAPAVR